MRGLQRRIASAFVGFVVAAALTNAAPGQQRSPSDRPIIVIGNVTAVSGNVISVETGAHVTDVATTDHTEIWKDKIYHGLSPVQIGDEFSARCRPDTSGKLVAEVVWLNIVNYYDGDTFEMVTNPNADPESAYVKKKLTVAVDANTIFDASAKDDLRAGRDVQMVGLDLKNGTVRATRLTVYEGNRPVRMKAGAKVMPVTGAAK